MHHPQDLISLKSLLPSTEKVLVKLSETEIVKDFTFVGGSALAVYLNHRKSEDIDLFTHNSELDLQCIQQTLTHLFKENIELINFNKQQADYICEDVKITFFANNWHKHTHSKPLINNLNIANLDLLAGMKINTIFLRAKYRDYYDLYVLNKEKIHLKQLYDIAQTYVPAINARLFQTALIFVDDIEDDNIEHLSPKYKISKQKISKHFENEIKKWLKNLV